MPQKDPLVKRIYDKWAGMFRRCYSPLEQAKRPSYIGCSVGEEFQVFENFLSWAKEQRGFDIVGWHLDKDIIVPGNKVYAPNRCAFVHQEINMLLTKSTASRGELPVGVYLKKGLYSASCRFKGVREELGSFGSPELAFDAYKQRKEEIIKAMAAEYKQVLDARIYEALMAYEVQITD